MATISLPLSRLDRHAQPTRTYDDLGAAFAVARSIPFDDSSRFVFFSDLHRGNNGKTDPFAVNKPLFVGALAHYLKEGFTYVEVGDGDDLWRVSSFAEIRRAHGEVFDLFHAFQRLQRLHLIFGNHEIVDATGRAPERDGLWSEEALIMQHTNTGQGIFVVHGHQVDRQNSRHLGFSRMIIRHVWSRLQQAGLAGSQERCHAVSYEARTKVAQRIHRWADVHRHLVICGHTHRPAFGRPGVSRYFNSGSGMAPGSITGIEIERGAITLVRWTYHAFPVNRHDRSSEQGRPTALLRRPQSPSTPLSSFR